MDYHALQQKLFEIEPSNPAEDLAKLQAQAGKPQESVAPTKNYVQESVEVPEGSLGMDRDYSVADFAALAGVRLDEKYKKGSAGQLKGKDSFKANTPTKGPEQKHPARGKLVGEAPDTPEFKSAWDLGKNAFKKYNTPDAMKGRLAGDDEPKDTKAGNVNKPAEKPATKGTDQKPKSNFPSGTVDGALYQIKPGDNVAYVNVKGKTNAGIVTVMLDTKDKKGNLQIQLKNRGAVYAIDRDKITHVNDKEFKLKDEGAGTGSIKDSLYAALEASKKKTSLKPRDPSAQTMQDLRRSGAMGAHKDKKKLAKQGYSKHKGKMDESKMSFDDMMKNREFYYTYKQYVRGNANIDQVAELVRGRVDKEQFAKEIHKQGVMMGGAKGDKIKELANYIRKDSNALDLPGKAFSKIKKMVGLGESYTKVDGMEAEELRKQYAKDWEIRKGKYLYKKVAFDDYNTVLRFLMVIEKPQIELDHFADIKFFYNEAELIVYTHDTKGLTTDDFKLAVQIDRALDRMGAKEIG